MGRHRIEPGFSSRRRGIPNVADELFVSTFNDHPGLDVNLAAQGQQRIPRTNRRHLDLVPQVVALAVGTQPHRIDHEEPRLAGFSHGAHHALDIVEEPGIGIVTSPGAQAEGGTAGEDGAADGIGGPRGLRDAVVLDHEQHRDTPHRGQIEAFVGQTLAERAVADDAGHDGAAVAHLLREREPRSNRGHAGLDAVAVKMSMDEVLAAAEPAAHAELPAHDFRDETVEISRVGEEMTVVAMVRQHDVVWIVQRAYRGHLTELLPEAGMNRSRQQTLREKLQQEQFGAPNQVAKRVERRGFQRQARLSIIIPVNSGQTRFGDSKRTLKFTRTHIGIGRRGRVGSMNHVRDLARRAVSRVPGYLALVISPV